MTKEEKKLPEHLHEWEKRLLEKPINLSSWKDFEKRVLNNWRLPRNL